MATDWTSLKSELISGLSSGKILKKSYTIEGQSVTFNGPDEVRKWIRLCDDMVAAESAGSVAMSGVVRFID